MNLNPISANSEATLELLKSLDLSYGTISRFSPGFVGEDQETVALAIQQLANHHFATRPILDGFLGLETERCLKICKVLLAREQVIAQGGQDDPSYPQILLGLLFHPTVNWDYCLDTLRRIGILDQKYLELMVRDPQCAVSIAQGLTSLENVRQNMPPDIFAGYCEAISAEGGRATYFGHYLAILYGFQNPAARENPTFEKCRNALIQYPEHACVMTFAFDELNQGGILEQHWQRVVEAKGYADEVARGIIRLESCPALKGREDCIAALVAGWDNGEHAQAIIEELYRQGPEVTLEEFLAFVETLQSFPPIK